MPHNDLNITVISAGAGSGKTYNLTERMVEMLGKGVRPSAIIATTFTKKAAAELQERVRARLIESGQREAANELGNALIGTVHSIGIKLLQRFAFDAGVSPLVEAIADGDEQRLFNESLSQILTNERTSQMNLLADRLGLTKKSYGEPFDWRASIRQLTDVARANNFSKETLEKSRNLSWQHFAELLPPPSKTDALTWNNRLIAAIEQTIAALENNESDTTAVTKNAVIQLRQMENELKWKGELYWHEWVKISKIAPGAKSRDLMEDLHELAASHEEHAQFHADIKGYIDLVFEIAMDALGEYERYKQKRGLIDYTDMETYISRLLRQPSVRETLATELDLLLVDEFQDTSPIQLDIFLQLSRIAKHSIWVGDPKQSIYGFRGAEPALMQAIIDATGGVKEGNILKESWRSRPDIVEATNAIFTRAFDQMPKEQVVLMPNFNEKKEAEFWAQQGRSEPHALMHWHFLSAEDNKKVPGAPWVEECIAQQIRVLLERQIPVFNKKRNAVRPVQPGDIAVLCRNNTGCEAMAEALHKAGLKAGIARAGLLETPEIRLALAWLKRLVNPNDRLSAAEIKLISGETSLESLLRSLQQADPDHKWAPLDLPSPGGDLHTQSAAEALDLLIAETDLRRTVAQLGNAVQRLDNLEVLRKYAVDYESACNRLHSAATIGGFLLWLDRLAEHGKDYQGSGESPDTIRVLTYHKSKGLEYPVCICHSLDQKLKENIWGINLVSEDKPDLENILGGRWLRFWVNPYNDQLRNTRLDERVRQTEAFTEATRQALDEEARLLYVGLTRARDYLVFPTVNKPTKWLNRVFNRGNEDTPTLDPHSDETPFYTDGNRVLYCDTEQVFQPRVIGEIHSEEAPYPFHAPHAGKQDHFPYRIAPAQEAAPGNPTQKIGAPTRIAAALTYEGDKTPVEQALLALLLAHSPSLALAEHQIQIRRIESQIGAAALAQQTEAVLVWINSQFAPQRIQKAVPLRAHYNGRLLEQSIDLLATLPDQSLVAILLIRQSTGGIKSSVVAHIPTLLWIRDALQRCFPGQKIRTWAVDAVEGEGVEVE